MVVVLATVTITAFLRTGSSSFITSSATSSWHFFHGGVWRMWLGNSNSNSKPLWRVSDLPMCTGVDPVISGATTSAIVPLQ